MLFFFFFFKSIAVFAALEPGSPEWGIFTIGVTSSLLEYGRKPVELLFVFFFLFFNSILVYIINL